LCVLGSKMISFRKKVAKAVKIRRIFSFNRLFVLSSLTAIWSALSCGSSKPLRGNSHQFIPLTHPRYLSSFNIFPSPIKTSSAV